MNPRKTKTNLEDIVFNGKLPPQDLPLEEAVLGAAMLEKHAAGQVMEILSEDTFYSDSHKLIWKAITSLSRSNKPIDILTVTEQLRKTGELELAGGAYAIMTIPDRVASAANIEYHALILTQKYMARELIRIAGEIGKQAFDDATDPFELKDFAITQIEKLGVDNLAKIKTLATVLKDVYDGMKEASVSESDLLGLPNKLKSIRKATLGYCAPDVIVLAAYTGQGKTAYTLSEAYFLAKLGHPVAFMCAEMKDFQLAWRIISQEISAEVNDIRLAKFLSEEQWDRALELVRESYNIPLYLLDVSGYNINQICGLAKEMKRKHKIELMVLDYLQLIDGPPEMKFGNREVEVSYVSKKIKQLAMQIQIPIIELCQLKRPESGVKRIPYLTDLRESGAIEQNADEVGFLFTPHYFGITSIKDDDRVYGPMDTIFSRAKCRNGSITSIVIKYDRKYNRFEDYESLSQIVDTFSFTDRTVSARENDSESNLPF